jgi:hypothetical protein
MVDTETVGTITEASAMAVLTFFTWRLWLHIKDLLDIHKDQSSHHNQVHLKILEMLDKKHDGQ